MLNFIQRAQYICVKLVITENNYYNRVFYGFDRFLRGLEFPKVV